MDGRIELSEEEIEAKELPEDKDELEFRRGGAERAKIGIVEGLMVLMTAAAADTLELFAGFMVWIPILGQIAWLFAFTFGFFVSGTLLLWAFLRGVSGGTVMKKVVKRLIMLAGGFLADALTAGILPIRTITMALTIWLNNRAEGKELSGIIKLLEKV